jgi:hypothetical protein
MLLAGRFQRVVNLRATEALVTVKRVRLIHKAVHFKRADGHRFGKRIQQAKALVGLASG